MGHFKRGDHSVPQPSSPAEVTEQKAPGYAFLVRRQCPTSPFSTNEDNNNVEINSLEIDFGDAYENFHCSSYTEPIGARAPQRVENVTRYDGRLGRSKEPIEDKEEIQDRRIGRVFSISAVRAVRASSPFNPAEQTILLDGQPLGRTSAYSSHRSSGRQTGPGGSTSRGGRGGSSRTDTSSQLRESPDSIDMDLSSAMAGFSINDEPQTWDGRMKKSKKRAC